MELVYQLSQGDWDRAKHTSDWMRISMQGGVLRQFSDHVNRVITWDGENRLTSVRPLGLQDLLRTTAPMVPG